MRNASTQIFVNGDHHDDSRKKRTRSQNLCRKIRRKAEGSTDKCKTYARTSRRDSRSDYGQYLPMGKGSLFSAGDSIPGNCKTLQVKNDQRTSTRGIRLEKFSKILEKFSTHPLALEKYSNIIAIVNSAMANPNKSQIRPHVPS